MARSVFLMAVFGPASGTIWPSQRGVQRATVAASSTRAVSPSLPLLLCSRSEQKGVSHSCHLDIGPGRYGLACTCVLETDVAFIVYISTDPASLWTKHPWRPWARAWSDRSPPAFFLTLHLLIAKAEDHLRIQEMASHLVAQRSSESHRRCGSVPTRISARTRPLGLPTTHTCKPSRLSWFPRWHLLASRLGTTHAGLECACIGLSLERW